MSSLLVSNEPLLVVEVLDQDILFQNQGPYLMQVGLTPDLEGAGYLNIWESVIFQAGTEVWASCPTAMSGQGSTIFWSEIIGALP
jgi:hypothetical protein